MIDIKTLRQSSSTGFSLIEVMISLMILSILLGFSTHLFQRQKALLQLQRVVHAFIADAQLTRQYSRELSTFISMQPLSSNHWNHGWQIQVGDSSRGQGVRVLKQYAFHAENLTSHIQVAEDQLKPSQQFTDMSTPRKIRHISFNRGQIALLHNGGFVANRIIWQHQRYPDLMRHIILGPGGRWRICNPKEDNQACLNH